MPNWRNFKFYNHPYNSLRNKFPTISEGAFDLLNAMLTYDPERRISASKKKEEEEECEIKVHASLIQKQDSFFIVIFFSIFPSLGEALEHMYFIGEVKKKKEKKVNHF